MLTRLLLFNLGRNRSSAVPVRLNEIKLFSTSGNSDPLVSNSTQLISTSQLAPVTKSSPILSSNELYPHAPIRQFFEPLYIDRLTYGRPRLIPSGRPWFARELRMKSFEDLHRLHFILLIERNKLLTDKIRRRKIGALLPNPERLKKVKISMKVFYKLAHDEKLVRIREEIVFWGMVNGKLQTI